MSPLLAAILSALLAAYPISSGHCVSCLLCSLRVVPVPLAMSPVSWSLAPVTWLAHCLTSSLSSERLELAVSNGSIKFPRLGCISGVEGVSGA